MLAVGEEMQQRHVEQRGVPQEGEVTAVGRISRSGARDRGSDIFGVRALDRLVAVASATSTGARIDCSWVSAQLGSVSHILQ